MPENKTQNIDQIHFRAKLPRYFRYAALGALIVTLFIVAVGFFRERNKATFHLKSEHTQLSKDVVAEVNGYERLETDGDIPKYYVKADRAITFSDNHQEMENVFIQVYDDQGVNSDKITGAKAIYIPEENKNFTAYLAGSVNIQTRDALMVKTEHITYTKATETAEADESVEFERDNVTGKAIGAVVKIKGKRLELLKDVEINTFESPELAKTGVREATVTASNAVFDQLNQKIEFNENVAVNISSRNKVSNVPQTTHVNCGRASVTFDNSGQKNPALKQLELFDAVKIESVENEGKATQIESGYALYDKSTDRFQLKNAVHILTAADEQPTNISANEAVYEQSNGKIALMGAAEITQAKQLLKGDAIDAQLSSNKKLKNAVVRGNAFLRQAALDRSTEITSGELNASFNESQDLLFANAVGESTAVLTPAQAAEYSKAALFAPKAIHLWFKGEGLIDRMQTDGRTTIQLSVPDNSVEAANKRLTADSVRTFFGPDSNDLQKAEAVGNAELYVEPLRVSAENYKTTINAPRFDCDFYPTGNNAKSCVAAVKTKTVRVPTTAAEGRGTQTITADKLTALFSAQSKDIERLDAAGGAKFTELDRNAISGQFSFTTSDQVVRLRGSEPTVWDLKARAKAREIDWDTRNQKSFLRGGVSTTYYNQEQTGGATPFSDPGKPVYITAENAEIDHRNETGRYTGNARGWQENNYVRAETFLIDQRHATFIADGAVQSLLYDAKRKENGKESNVPVYASAKKMSYERDKRFLRYESSVDIRQGSDRILADTANIFLNEKNELSQTIAENNVVITQPGRRATGEYAQYNASEESVILKGNPAKVDDRENGASQGGQIIVYMREHRVVGEGKSVQNATGRIRSVYKVKTN